MQRKRAWTPAACNEAVGSSNFGSSTVYLYNTMNLGECRAGIPLFRGMVFVMYRNLTTAFFPLVQKVSRSAIYSSRNPKTPHDILVHAICEQIFHHVIVLHIHRSLVRPLFLSTGWKWGRYGVQVRTWDYNLNCDVFLNSFDIKFLPFKRNFGIHDYRNILASWQTRQPARPEATAEALKGSGRGAATNFQSRRRYGVSPNKEAHEIMNFKFNHTDYVCNRIGLATYAGCCNGKTFAKASRIPTYDHATFPLSFNNKKSRSSSLVESAWMVRQFTIVLLSLE